jgi:hypothetical protein
MSAQYEMRNACWYWREDEEWVGPFRSLDDAMADYRERLKNQTPKEQP